MTVNTDTNVAVLMTVRNGIAYLFAQIKSILEQVDCNVTLFISDDLSTDGSLEYIKSAIESSINVRLLLQGSGHGSAAKNFYRLILDVDTSMFDYIAFADQDDIWDLDKLSRHIALLTQHKAEGVSSNVTAFWPDGRERLLHKAQPQRELDYLFESAGPGCTFLMTPWLVDKVREQLLNDTSPAKDVALHDWLTYAVCRAHGGKWVIDPVPSLRYRQHGHNVVGANVGLKAKWARLKKLKQGWYRQEVIKIAQVCTNIAPNNTLNQLAKLLKNKTLISQFKLLGYVCQARRSLLDRVLLAILIGLGLF